MQRIDDKNPADIDGITPLHIAAKKGHLDVCKLIIPKIRNRNPRDKLGFTPKIFAEWVKQWEIVDLFNLFSK